ncbi:MAG: heme biosynthesis HemY N-terminal domain-containing protein [Gammaproteobacteria bacterium]
MVRLFLLVFMLAAGVGLALFTGEDSGYLLLAWNGWRVEVNNLVLAMALLLVLFLVVHWLLNGAAALQRGHRRWQFWRSSRRDRGGQRQFYRGLHLLAEGRWTKAEKQLVRSASQAENNLLAYLGAARAADNLGNPGGRDRYIAAAARSGDSSALAVGLLRAECLAGSGEFDQAIAVLRKLRDAEPGHSQVLKQLQEYCLQAHDWRGLLELTPALRRQQLIDHKGAERLHRRCHLEQLKNADNLQEAWRHLPKKYAHDAEMLGFYLRVLVADGQVERALDLIERELNRQIDAGLLDLFGSLDAENPDRRLSSVEKWLQASPENPALLLAAGRMAARAGLTDKAINFYEARVAVDAEPQSCAELAQLLIAQQRSEDALVRLREGLELALRVPVT